MTTILKLLAITVFLVLLNLPAAFAEMTMVSPIVDVTENISQSCGCHDELNNESLTKIYVHLPFHLRQCTICHLPDVTKAEAPKKIPLLAANQPVKNNSGGPSPQAGDTEKDFRVKQLPSEAANHFLAGERYRVNVTICYSCHANIRAAGGHPDNVVPSFGMTVPADYPTLSDGRITCLSCHAGHSSEYKFMTIKPSQKELCLGCHKGYSR